ncbi:unnamed protein product [Amoebophrya sp. A120]|nr:unnamed protein product [Amoebophrya sp. A120]|eukprot:GSA120T00017940001.1
MWELLAEEPLALVWHNFASKAECAALIAAGADANAALSGGASSDLLPTEISSKSAFPRTDGDSKTRSSQGHLPNSALGQGDTGDQACSIQCSSSLRTVLDATNGIVYGYKTFKRLYKLPASRKLRGEFEIETEPLCRKFEAVIGELLSCPSHAEESRCVLNLTPRRQLMTGAGKNGTTGLQVRNDVTRGALAPLWGDQTTFLLENGLHVDTFNEESRRFATAILYLNTVEDVEDAPEQTGMGHTVFPVERELGQRLLSLGFESTDVPVDSGATEVFAEAQTCLRALQESAKATLRDQCRKEERERKQACLLDKKMTSSAHRIISCRGKKDMEQDPQLQIPGASSCVALSKRVRAKELLAHTDACSSTRGFAVRPEQGKLLVFFTRDAKGNVDPCSWHGSAQVYGVDKWTLQTFKAVPMAPEVAENRKTEHDEASERVRAFAQNARSIALQQIISGKMNRS